MSKQSVKKAPKKKNGYVMPDPIPNGEIIQDMSKKKWIIGPSIGVGGFGEIYSASEYSEKKSTNYPYVIKIEPHGNGPLFVEMHFYMRNAKLEDIESWKAKKNLKTLGMPAFLGSGSHECNGTKYRFVVMEKFGKDLWKLYLENKKCFPIQTAFQISVQILDVLEYIHSKGYVHADIKGQNILLGLSKNTQNQVYLVDFGLAAHYTTKEFKADPKKAHNGTIEYTSRDAHCGVPTRRGDLEILAYNLIHWLGGSLPWEKNLNDMVAVQNAKIKFIDNLDESLNSCFKIETLESLKNFFYYVKKMEYNTEPDYEKCRSILVSGIEATNFKLGAPLDFSGKIKSPKRRTEEIVIGSPEAKKQKMSKTKSSTAKPRKITKKDKENLKEDDNTDTNSKNDEKMETENISNGFTAEMLRVKKRIEEKKGKPKKNVIKLEISSSNSKVEKNNQKSQNSLKRKSPKKNSDSDTDIIEGTPSPPKISRKKNVQNANNLTPTRSSTRSKKTVFYGNDKE